MFTSTSIDLTALAREVDVETMRSSGLGGQHVNKTSNAVRITHKPSGIQVRAESDRSQHRNRQLAMERLQLMLASGEKDNGIVVNCSYSLIMLQIPSNYLTKVSRDLHDSYA